MQLARKKHSDLFPPSLLPLTRSFHIQFFGVDFKHEADWIFGNDRGIQFKRIHALLPLQNTSWAVNALLWSLVINLKYQRGYANYFFLIHIFH